MLSDHQRSKSGGNVCDSFLFVPRHFVLTPYPLSLLVAAYHSAILGNQDVFRDKIVMDIGTGSGILSVWAAQAGARKVYAIEYTDMAKHAEKVMKANGVEDIVTVLQCAVEDVKLPIDKDQLVVEEDGTERCVDIIISEWCVSFV